MSFLQYFFTYENSLPEGVGFTMYGTAHLLWLAVLFLELIFVVGFYRKASEVDRKLLDIAMGGEMMFWIVIRTVYLILVHEMSMYELPLHMCSLAGIFCFLHAFRKWDWLGQLLYCVAMPGALAALLFPDWTMYPAVSFISIEAFAFHGLIPIYVFCQLSAGKIVPALGKVWKVILALVLLVTPLYFFDKKVHANYMFVNVPSKGSPLEILGDLMGNPGYLVGYGLIVLMVICLMDVMYFMGTRKSRNDAKR